MFLIITYFLRLWCLLWHVLLLALITFTHQTIIQLAELNKPTRETQQLLYSEAGALLAEVLLMVKLCLCAVKISMLIYDIL